MKLLIISCFALTSLSVLSQPWICRDSFASRDSITLFFAGDVMQHSPQIKAAWDSLNEDYDYKPCFQYISPYWQKADYVIANLETTLADDGFSGYPQFCAPWQLARDLKECGVDFLTTNNNHSCDKGHQGIRKTIHYLDSLGISHTGTFLDTASWISQTPFFIRRGYFKIALLSYTYGTNEIPVTNGQIVSMIDTFHMARQIEKARLDTATHIIAFMHWGIEYETTQNTNQKRLADWLHKKGVDIVVGSHPHVVQPLEYTIDRNRDTVGITVYSLGNFVSNQSQRFTNGGICVQLTLTRKNGKNHYQMEYLSNYVYRPIENGIRKYYIIPEPLAKTLLESRDSVLYNEFFKDTEAIIKGATTKLN